MSPRHGVTLAVATAAIAAGPLLADDAASASKSGDAAYGSPAAGTSPSEAPPAAAPTPAEPVDLQPPAEALPSHERPLDKWYIQPSITLWMPSINGTVGARGVTSSVDESFIDILQNSDSVIGMGGSLEFGKGKLGGYVNGFYSRIGVDKNTAFGQTDIINSIGLMGFGVSYEIGRWPMQHTATTALPSRDLTLNLYGGGRYSSIGLEFDFADLPTRERDREWVDPIIGAKMVLPLAPSWSIVGYGEVGGFGAASDFAWGAGVLASWDFHLGRFPSSLQFGYLAVGDDYTSGSGNDRFVWDTILHGPILNFQMRF